MNFRQQVRSGGSLVFLELQVRSGLAYPLATLSDIQRIGERRIARC